MTSGKHDQRGLPIDRPAAWATDRRSGTSETPQGGLADGNSAPTDGSTVRRRVGRRRLQAVLESLSPRDLAVLRSIGEHRFLGTRHVEVLHFHDHATAISGARAARRVLRRLYHDGLLTRLERRIGGIRAGSAGHIWTLAPAGLRALTSAGTAIDRQRQHEPSLRLLNHCLAIAETHIELVAASRNGRFELTSVQLEPASWRRFLGLGGETRLVRPDLAIVTSAGDYEDHWFLEVDLGSEHPPTVVRKCRLYLDYQASGDEQDRLGIFPRLVWVVPHDRRSERLTSALRAAQLDANLFRVTTVDRLSELIAGGAG